MVEPKGQRTEVESEALWLEVETGDSHAKTKLGTGRHEANLPLCRGPTVDEPRD